jgi:hypothetical protein
MEEINNIFEKIDNVEVDEAAKHKQDIILRSREHTIKYKEDGRCCSPLPIEDVKLDRGINVYIPGFISFDFINLSTVYFKFSLPDKKRFLTEEMLIKKVMKNRIN